MSAIPSTDEDPLIAALPPNTDYITYLTILEYQLSSKNLSTLNGILRENDGTLAREIGWDLLRLVLPMLLEVHTDATECLDLIAKQGNPREIVVRIAEELEKLGRFDEDENEDTDADEGDELPTFAGEAARVHLGSMKLDGMPEVEKTTIEPVVGTADTQLSLCNIDEIVFTALLSMLSTVHPRIKTQYPSRFLATSLPAALAAYRQIAITNATTEAFLSCLSILAGRQRPPLPLRSSTSATSDQHSVQATLPDPEAPEEAQQGSNIAAQNEKNIIKRLLQAVMLEVLDDYLASLQGEDVSSMIWTRRLRESVESHRVVPRNPTSAELFQQPPLDGRDALMRRFMSLVQVLDLDMQTEIDKITSARADPPGTASVNLNEEETPSDYPTSPSQVPVPTTGCILMSAAGHFTHTISSTPHDLQTLIALFDIVTPLSDMPKIPNPAVQDALHSLLLQAITSETWDLSMIDPTSYTRLMAILTQAFTITPDTQSRDDAHYLATKLLQIQPSSDLRLATIKQTITGEVKLQDVPSNPEDQTTVPLATPFTEGALKAVGINWLKDDILASLSPQQQAPSDSAATMKPPHQPLKPSILETDRILSVLLFCPRVPPTPSVKSDSNSLSPEDNVNNFLLSIAHYIALLNFCSVLISRIRNIKSPSPLSTGANVSTINHPRDLLPTLLYLTTNAYALLNNVFKPWLSHLISVLDSANPQRPETELHYPEDLQGQTEDQSTTEDYSQSEIHASAPDIYALEDAVMRLERCLAAGQSSTPAPAVRDASGAAEGP